MFYGSTVEHRQGFTISDPYESRSVRKQELKLKEKERERLFEQQREMMRLMQSQQQSMMDLVSKLVNK